MAARSGPGRAAKNVFSQRHLRANRVRQLRHHLAGTVCLRVFWLLRQPPPRPPCSQLRPWRRTEAPALSQLTQPQRIGQPRTRWTHQSARAVSGAPSSPTFTVGRSALKKRARRFGTAGAPQASEPRPDDMAADEGSIPLGHDPSSMDSDSVNPHDGGTNLTDSVSDG